MGKMGGGGLAAKKPTAISGHFWPLRAEGRRFLALRQWRFHHPLAQESGVRLGLHARSSTMRRWSVAEETGAFLIEAAYDARRHHKRLPHIVKLLLRRPAFSKRGPRGSSPRSRRSTRWPR